jgi:Protein of unknown function (DUF664)
MLVKGGCRKRASRKSSAAWLLCFLQAARRQSRGPVLFRFSFDVWAAGLRFIILHVIAETACDAGHLDAVRETGGGCQWIAIRSCPRAGRLDNHVVSPVSRAPPAG